MLRKLIGGAEVTTTRFAARVCVVALAIAAAIGANASASDTKVIVIGSEASALSELEDLARIAGGEGLTPSPRG